MILVGSLCAASALFGPGAGRLRADAAVRWCGRLGFWLLGLGLVLGAWWADRAWGRWWAFDAKESWALVTWLCLLGVVHVRAAGGGAGFGVGLRSVLMLLALVAMLWTSIGVNLFLPTLHAWGGAVDGG